VYFLSPSRNLKSLRRLDDIQRSFLCEQFSREEKTECACWDPPFCTNSVTFAASGGGGGGNPGIVNAMRCGSKPLLGDALLQIELPIGFADVQESIDTAQQFAQQLAFELLPDPNRVAARISVPAKPNWNTNPSRFKHGLPIGGHLPALNPKHVRTHVTKFALKAAFKSQPPK
jgi:hypothetical protein